MNKKLRRPLQLDRTTIRSLTYPQMREAGGGRGIFTTSGRNECTGSGGSGCVKQCLTVDNCPSLVICSDGCTIASAAC